MQNPFGSNDLRADLFAEERRRNLEDNVRHVKACKQQVVVVSCETKVALEARQPRVALFMRESAVH